MADLAVIESLFVDNTLNSCYFFRHRKLLKPCSKRVLTPWLKLYLFLLLQSSRGGWIHQSKYRESAATRINMARILGTMLDRHKISRVTACMCFIHGKVLFNCEEQKALLMYVYIRNKIAMVSRRTKTPFLAVRTSNTECANRKQDTSNVVRTVATWIKFLIIFECTAHPRRNLLTLVSK